MKKIMCIMALAAIGMASCQKETADQNSDQSLTTSSDFRSTSALNILVPNTNSELLLRHRPGKDSACGRIPLDSLAQSIKDYVATNYPGAIIEFAAKERTGNVYVIIKLTDDTAKILQFDVNGNFVKELDRKVRGPKGPHGPKNHGNHLATVDPTTLLPAITTYIDANYIGATIVRAGSTVSGEFIVLINLNGVHKALLFDANGNFVKELK